MVRPVVQPAQPFMTTIRAQPVPQVIAAPAQIVQPTTTQVIWCCCSWCVEETAFLFLMLDFIITMIHCLCFLT